MAVRCHVEVHKLDLACVVAFSEILNSLSASHWYARGLKQKEMSHFASWDLCTECPLTFKSEMSIR